MNVFSALPIMPYVLTRQLAAAYLSISQSTFDNLVRTGDLPPDAVVIIGGRPKYRVSALNEYVNSKCKTEDDDTDSFD